MESQRAAWDRLYSGNPRPWRGADPGDGSLFPSGALVLEVGCGSGKTAAAMVSEGVRVVCCDYSEEAVKVCKANVPDAEGWVVADARALPFRDGVFDGVSIIHVLEHLSDAAVAVGEAVRVLKPGGTLYARSFSDNDMRAGKGEPVGGFTVRGNGIGYVYRSAEGFAVLFPGVGAADVAVSSKRTRFGGTRETLSVSLVKPSAETFADRG
ncbi:MAG: class I SAM-dependent methyltransferase [Thermoplasmatales archaeon]|nr:class I SAM-dependent methyltransferase [Thermoplasmatales archaeon]